MSAARISTSVPRRHRILIVEDEYLQAEIVQRELEDLEAEVLGPVASVAAALALLAAGTPVDSAILDMGPGDGMAFPVAKVPRAQGIPFMFTTGYDRRSLPSIYAHVACCEKPFNVGLGLWTLLGQTIVA